MDYGYGESSEGGKDHKGVLGRGSVYPIDRCGQDILVGQRGNAPTTSHLGNSMEVFPIKFFHVSAKWDMRNFLELQ